MHFLKSHEFDDKAHVSFYSIDSSGLVDPHTAFPTDAQSVVAILTRSSDGKRADVAIKIDLHQLEGIAERAMEILKSPYGVDGPYVTERVRGLDVVVSPWPTRGQPDTLAIQLKEEGAESQGRPFLWLPLDTLKDIIAEGRTLQRDIGREPTEPTHAVIRASSLAERQSDGFVVADILKQFGDRDEARRFMHDKQNVALCPETRGLTPDHSKIEMPSHAVLEFPRWAPRTVAAELGRQQLDNERRSDHFIIAKWDYDNVPPTLDNPVEWSGDGIEHSSGKFEDYKAMPYRSTRFEEQTEELYVLIRRHEKLPNVGYIEAISGNKPELAGLLILKEVDLKHEIEQKQQRDLQQQREITTDWDKQTFRRER